ncbi:MAG: DUF4392 domain-containing protein [Alphaproteobacteria bacterium]|jgi:hypothetical protein|nr:DUF4392 domain-containing protein [Alphaproteobacteria bacterium]
MRIAADNMEKLLCVEMRRRGIPRGFKWRIYEIARATADEPLMLAAARPLAGARMRVALVTGAWVPDAMPVGESDGPYGTVALARALEGVGHEVAIYTDPECAPPIDFLARYLGLQARVVGVERGAPTVNPGIVEASDAIVAIERLGQNVHGELYSMNGFRVTDEQHSFDDCFRAMQAAGKPTISITDGGNEIGYGKIRDALIGALPDLNLAERTACGGGIVCATDCDVLVVANSSNLGCYGVAGALALLCEDLSLCHRPEDEVAMHHVGVGLGLIDGGGGGAVPWCDGIPAEASAAMVLLVRNIVERVLEEPRERPF